MDTDRLSELKKEAAKTEKDLSKVLDMHLGEHSPGVKALAGIIKETMVISGQRLYDVYTKAPTTTTNSEVDFWFKLKGDRDVFSDAFAQAKTPIETLDPNEIVVKDKMYVDNKKYFIACPPLFPRLNFHYDQHKTEFQELYDGYVTFSNPLFFVESFDFMHECAVYDFASEELVIPHSTIEVFDNLELRVNPRLTQMALGYIIDYENKKLGNKKLDEPLDIAMVKKLKELDSKFEHFSQKGMAPGSATVLLFRKIKPFLEQVAKG